MKKRILLLLTVALVMTAMMVATAAPGFAAPGEPHGGGGPWVNPVCIGEVCYVTRGGEGGGSGEGGGGEGGSVFVTNTVCDIELNCTHTLGRGGGGHGFGQGGEGGGGGFAALLHEDPKPTNPHAVP
jgi:hypothetical protein